jgi:multicomponent Na+:H+ antiporter subunit G
LTVEEIIKLIVAILILLGAILSLLSSFGLLRLPDVYTRSHAATKSATLGVISILSGAFIYFWAIEGHISPRLLLGIVFVFITAPVAGHLICRAAYRIKVPLWEKSAQDELKLVLKKDDYRHNVEE